MWFMEEPSQFSVGQTAQSLTCSIMEKSHTGFDDCLRILLSCLRKRMSAGPGGRPGRGNILRPSYAALLLSRDITVNCANAELIKWRQKEKGDEAVISIKSGPRHLSRKFH